MMLHSFLQRCKTFKMFALALLLFCAAAVQGEEIVVCDLSDSDCVTFAARTKIGEAIKGEEGKWPSSETLYEKELVGIAEDLKYKFIEAYLSGFGTCNTTYLRFDTDNCEFYWNMRCVLLKSRFGFDFDGMFGGMDFSGQGTGESTQRNYNFDIFGTYENNNDQMTLYATKSLFIPDSPVSVHLVGLSPELNDFLNENWEMMDVFLIHPNLRVFMQTFLKNMNEYLKWNPTSEVFSYVKSD